MSEIKILVEELKEEHKKLEENIKLFKPYTEGFQSKTVGKLEEFNSDFIEEMKDTLENMADTKAPELLQKIAIFEANLKKVISNFETVDEELANGMSKSE